MTRTSDPESIVSRGSRRAVMVVQPNRSQTDERVFIRVQSEGASSFRTTSRLRVVNTYFPRHLWADG